MPFPAKKNEKYSYEDYKNWPDELRCEILDGVIYDMSPAPSVKHQDIALNFSIALKTHPDNPCHTLIAPTDVVLDEHNVVQPDVFLVYNPNIITELNVQGVPELIVEVVSPSTELKDRHEKKQIYEKFGVREYIIVFPDAQYMERYCLSDGEYDKPEIFNWNEILPLTFIQIQISLWEIFGRTVLKGEMNRI